MHYDIGWSKFSSSAQDHCSERQSATYPGQDIIVIHILRDNLTSLLQELIPKSWLALEPDCMSPNQIYLDIGGSPVACCCGMPGCTTWHETCSIQISQIHPSSNRRFSNQSKEQLVAYKTDVACGVRLRHLPQTSLTLLLKWDVSGFICSSKHARLPHRAPGILHPLELHLAGSTNSKQVLECHLPYPWLP